MTSMLRFVGLASLTILSLSAQEPFQKWPLSRAVQILNSSPWARQETYTVVVAGVGSGVSGEKEIFNRFYVRFVSAQPVREALARIQQLQFGYDGLAEADKRRFDEYAGGDLLSGFGDWIVVAVSFRSNDPNTESQVRRFFERETAETIKNKAFLSSEQYSQVPIRAYFPPRDEGIGAKFVFPREINGSPVVSAKTKTVAFELLAVPGANPKLRAKFAVKDMIVGGRVIL